MSRKGEDARPGPMVRGAAVCGAWPLIWPTASLQMVGQCLPDQQGQHIGNIFCPLKQDGPDALNPQTRARPGVKLLDQPRLAMHEKSKVTAGRCANAQAASGFCIWSQIGRLPPAKGFLQSTDRRQFCRPAHDHFTQGNQPFPCRRCAGIQHGLHFGCRAWRCAGHDSATGRCSSVMRSSGEVSIGVFRYTSKAGAFAASNPEAGSQTP